MKTRETKPVTKDWKGYPPKVSSICIVDDDEDRRRQLTELITLDFPKLNVRAVDDIWRAMRASGRWDYLIIDVSAVSPIMNAVHNAWSPIANFMEHHPGTEVIILSAMSRASTQEIVDAVAEATGAPEMVHYGGSGDWSSNYSGESLKDKLHSLIKPGDMDWTSMPKKK